MDDDQDRSPYHDGERELQRMVGVRDRAEQMGRKMIRDYMPDQHRELFSALPFVLVGCLDPEGRPWASLLAGPDGFVSSPDPRTLRFDALPHPSDPLASGLRAGAPLGVLGIQLETRRRNRANGWVGAEDERGFTLRVAQSFGNCPQYITRRTSLEHQAGPSVCTREGRLLTADAVRCIEASDTSFIASTSAQEPTRADSREGVDVSHRGGKPGFVHVSDEGGTTVLTMPDFAGNNAFNTLGNLLRVPRAGLLFVDFTRRDLLQLTCSTEIFFEGEALRSFRGALRLIRFRVLEGLRYAGGLPFRFSAGEPAPQLAATGEWGKAQTNGEELSAT